MLFIKSQKRTVLQLVLRNMIAYAQALVDKDNAAQATNMGNTFTDGIKMACVSVTTIPIILVYPFVQKYFIKGIMVGSIKS